MTLNSTPVGGAVGTGPTLGGEREWAAGGVAMATVGGHGAAAVRCHRGTGSGWGGVPRAPRDTDVPSGHRGTLLPHGAEGVQPSSGAADSARPRAWQCPYGWWCPYGLWCPRGLWQRPYRQQRPCGWQRPAGSVVAASP